MTVEADMRTYLAADATVAGLVTYSGRAHVYMAGTVPQSGTLTYFPRVTMFRVSGGHEHEVEGRAGFAKPRMQVDCWARTYAASKALATAVKDAMDDFDDSMTLDDERDNHEPLAAGSDERVYWVSLDFMVWDDE